MNEERRDKMKRLYKRGILVMTLLSMVMFMSGCQKDENQKVAEQFIKTQINCNTYVKSEGDKEVLKTVFLEFFTEESYQQYLDDVVGYFYPQLFHQLNADESNIKKIKCKEKTKDSGGTTMYEYEVTYTLTGVNEKTKKKDDTTKFVDYLQITVDEQNKITQVAILNTSDIIKKLFLDVKVQ